MAFDVHILKVETGETRVHRKTAEWDGGYEYMWADGNYACDCNRGLFFGRAGGENPRLEDAECGVGKFVVTGIYLPDGTEVFGEEEIPGTGAQTGL